MKLSHLVLGLALTLAGAAHAADTVAEPVADADPLVSQRQVPDSLMAEQQAPGPQASEPQEEAEQQEPGWQPSPATTPAWADRCTDFTRNGWAFKAPDNFTKWVDVFSDPGIYLEFAKRAMEPRAVVHSFATLLDPAAAKNYAEWADPVIYQKWAEALAQPDFYTRVNATLFDPGKMMNWVMLPLDPRPWQLLGTALNPLTWAKWITAPLDPKVWEPLLKTLPDPERQEMRADAADRLFSAPPPLKRL